MEKVKQNKNTSVVIRVASATLAAVILLFSFSITSFAYTNPESNNGLDFSNQPIAYDIGSLDSSNYSSKLTQLYDKGNGATVWAGTQSENLVYVFYASGAFQFYSPNASSNFTINIAYTTPNVNFNIVNMNYNSAHVGYYNAFSYSIDTSDIQKLLIPNYNSIEDGILAINNSNSSIGTVADFNYSIKPGYALFIDIHGLSDVSGTLYTNTSAAYASPHTSNQTLSYQSSLPSGNVSPQGNGINWQGTGNRDLFGRYKSWNRSLIIQPNSHYIAIYNPVHINTYVDPEHEDFNGNISVHVNKAYSETSILIPLNTELTSTGTVGTNTTEEQKPVVYDENTNSWIPQNSDGTPYTESPYGDYMPSTVNSIHDWLQNIANLISGFFNGAIGAVTTLVGAGSAFINQLVSLYSWLPAPVYAVLSSALILVITIGVIKVFI